MVKDKEASSFRRFYRIFRWCVLVALLVVITLALKRPGDVPEGVDPLKAPEQAREFESKLRQLLEAKSRGDSGTEVQVSAAEINAFLGQAMATQSGTTSSASATPGLNSPTPADSSNPGSGTTQQAMRELRLGVDDGGVVAFFVVDFHGKDLSITLSGRPGVSNGYLTFSPTGFKVGSLPIPMWIAGPRLEQKLNDPETHDKLKLPEFIGDLRVQSGQIVISEK
jgi:hypothetical protein